jgi:hypothetical protein
LKNRVCYFFTDDCKTSFVKQELNNLLKSFERVKLFSKEKIDIEDSKLQNVVIAYDQFDSRKNLLNNFGLFAKVMKMDFDPGNARWDINFFRRKLSVLNRCIYLASQIEKDIDY